MRQSCADEPIDNEDRLSDTEQVHESRRKIASEEPSQIQKVEPEVLTAGDCARPDTSGRGILNPVGHQVRAHWRAPPMRDIDNNSAVASTFGSPLVLRTLGFHCGSHSLAAIISSSSCSSCRTRRKNDRAS